VPIDDAGNLLLSEFEELPGPRTKLVAASQVFNALGTVVPVDKMVKLAHRYGARVLIDGASPSSTCRSTSPNPVRISSCSLDTRSTAPPESARCMAQRQRSPKHRRGRRWSHDRRRHHGTFALSGAATKFEAGTGNIAGAVGLAEALRYVQRLGVERIAAYEHALLEYATPRLADIPGVRLIGTATEKASVLSFVLAGHDPLEVGKALNAEGIAVRAGHHCAQPALRRLGLEATVRPSFAFYNTFEEIDVLLNAVRRIAEGGAGVG
jgi:cysteine desulfurase / selenocysteine lyase